MTPKPHRIRLAALLAALLLVGCASDDERLLGVENPTGGALLTRYVSLGSSITAGFQSGGLTDSLQRLAYPALVARQAGTPFTLPLLRDPGCPAPFVTTIFVQPTPRVGGLDAGVCAFLDEDSIQPGPIQNVAAAGTLVTGLIGPPSDPETDAYRTLLLGGRSQIRAMADADPTFVSAWLGNSETLAAAVAGDPSSLLPQARFEVALDSIVRGIRGTRARDAALLAPIDPLAFSPRFLPGAWFHLAAAAGLLPRPVAASCAPGGPGARSLVALDVVVDPAVQVVSCGETDPYVSSPAETRAFALAVASYTDAIRARAAESGWIFIDPATRFADVLADPARIRKCQALAAAATPAELLAAVQATCPLPVAPFFGSWISFDATHPSSEGHRAVANVLIGELNAKHGLQIPPAAP